MNMYKLIKEVKNIPSDELIKFKQIVEKYEETFYDEAGAKNKLLSIINEELKKRE